MCDLAGVEVEGGSKATWYNGKEMALQAMADETYGPGHKPIVMKMRSKHSSFKKCDRCSELRALGGAQSRDQGSGSRFSAQGGERGHRSSPCVVA
eukprot:scaffold32409_cov112-Isochrysis_galbana.AAC.1